MQINSHWFSRLSPFGVNKDNLLSDACYNVHIGAWVQSQNFSTHGYNWNSVGAYNAGFSAKTLTRRLTYIRKIKAALATLNQPNYSFPKTWFQTPIYRLSVHTKQKESPYRMYTVNCLNRQLPPLFFWLKCTSYEAGSHDSLECKPVSSSRVTQ